MNYGQRFVMLYRRPPSQQEAGIKTIPKKKKCKKAKWLSGEALQIAVIEEKRKAKEKRKDTPIRM